MSPPSPVSARPLPCRHHHLSRHLSLRSLRGRPRHHLAVTTCLCALGITSPSPSHVSARTRCRSRHQLAISSASVQPPAPPRRHDLSALGITSPPSPESWSLRGRPASPRRHHHLSLRGRSRHQLAAITCRPPGTTSPPSPVFALSVSPRRHHHMSLRGRPRHQLAISSVSARPPGTTSPPSPVSARPPTR
jgi:hypothetical protein